MKWKLAQFLELIWWKRYLRKKGVNEYVIWKKEYWNNFILKTGIQRYLKKDTEVLDIGCGPAGIFINLNAQQVVAVDPLINNYELNLKHFKRTNYSNVSFISKSFEDFETDKCFDVVFCLNAINHFRDFNYSIKKLQRVLKKGGVLILSIDVHRFSFLKHLFRFIPGDALHPHQHSKSDYMDLMKALTNIEYVDHKILNRGNIFNYEVLVYRKK